MERIYLKWKELERVDPILSFKGNSASISCPGTGRWEGFWLETALIRLRPGEAALRGRQGEDCWCLRLDTSADWDGRQRFLCRFLRRRSAVVGLRPAAAPAFRLYRDKQGRLWTALRCGAVFGEKGEG